MTGSSSLAILEKELTGALLITGMYRRSIILFDSSNTNYPGKIFSNLYQVGISYPFDVTKSVRINVGVRKDRVIASTFDDVSLKCA